MSIFHFCVAMLQVMKNGFWHNRKHTFLVITKWNINANTKIGNSFTQTSGFVSCRIWKVSSITSHWNMEGPSIQTFIASSLTHLKCSALVNRKILFFGMAMPGHVLQKKPRKKIRRLGCEILLWPQYSPNLAPTDFHLFRSLEHLTSVRRSRNKEDIEKNSSNVSFWFGKKPLWNRKFTFRLGSSRSK